MKKDILMFENHFNSVFTYKQIKVLNVSIDKSENIIEIEAQIITDKNVLIPNYIFSSLLDLKSLTIILNTTLDKWNKIINDKRYNDKR